MNWMIFPEKIDLLKGPENAITLVIAGFCEDFVSGFFSCARLFPQITGLDFSDKSTSFLVTTQGLSLGMNWLELNWIGLVSISEINEPILSGRWAFCLTRVIESVFEISELGFSDGYAFKSIDGFGSTSEESTETSFFGGFPYSANGLVSAPSVSEIIEKSWNVCSSWLNGMCIFLWLWVEQFRKSEFPSYSWHDETWLIMGQLIDHSR